MPRLASELEMREARVMLGELASEIDNLFQQIKRESDPAKKQRLVNLFDGVCETLAIKSLGGSQ